mmetsp:Transcript_103259/g.296400  ORF Transcript_103259/g.296400 Transcript_103259/m.296400 type:complete len:407 (+) Transcript_103259:96-1316(+)
MMSPMPRPAEPGCGGAMMGDEEAPEGSPASSPSLGPSKVPKRRRAGSDDEGSFLLDGEDSVRVQAAIEASLQQDIKRRMIGSLRETCADLEAAYPEETKGGGFKRARERASSELSDFVRSREATPMLGPARPLCSPSLSFQMLPPAASPSRPGSPAVASPSLGPALPPAAEEGDVEFELKVADAVPSMYEHDGLVDHEELMRAIYASQGLDFAAVQGQAQNFLEEIGLRPHDMGVMNVDEHGNMLINQCFYLSIARGYLGHEVPWQDTSELALKMKRAIEASVLAERPGWVVGDEPGDEAMAFADFLPVAMKASSSEGADLCVLAELAVCILDSAAGHVEVYLGSRYNDLEDEESKERNLVLLWYTPGHYQCLVVNDEDGSKVQLTYDSFKELLSNHGVQYIETLE